MKSISVALITCFLLALTAYNSVAQDLSAREIVKKADDLMRGESSVSRMSMQIVRPTWERTVEFKSWTKGRDYSMTLITAPAKEAGQTFLKRQTEMWNWQPTISRMIKLPPSMMSQGWMGSDYSNDDILKESSIVVDYNHKILGAETVSGYDCYKIELTPKADAAVVWGKILKWISKDGFFQIRSEYYDEDGYLIKTEKAYDVKQMDDRRLPTTFEIIPEEDPGHKTIVKMLEADFNVDISDSFFSQQKMKNLR